MKSTHYPQYSPANIEWLENAPTHWKSVPIKYVALEQQSLFLDGDWIESKDLADEGVRYLTTGNVGEGRFKEQGAGFISDEKFTELKCTEVLPGDMLVSRLNRPIGRACIVPHLGLRIVTSVDNVIVRADCQYDRSFLVYLFSSKEYFRHTDNLSRGATMQRISRGLLGNIRIVIPPLDEQTQIAKFLDYETAKIDALIEKQQQLIALLKEKRQAVISHAVTKGLNPDAPMRDSGVEWLGEVPAHWRVMRFGLTNIRAELGGNYLAGEGEDGITVVKMGNIGRGEIRLEKVERLPASDGYADAHLLRFGDFLFNTRNSIDLVGKVAVWRSEIELAVYNSNILRVEFSKLFIGSTRFVSYLFNSTLAIGLLRLFAKGTTSVAAIYYKDLRQIIFAFPPCDEQSVISDELDRKCLKFDAAIERADSMSNLLQERRTALVSAAVTGKIDVRGWKPPESKPQTEAA